MAVDSQDLAYERRQQAFMKHVRCFGTMMAICLTIWRLGGAGFFWPVFPMVFGGLKLGNHARDIYG